MPAGKSAALRVRADEFFDFADIVWADLVAVDRHGKRPVAGFGEDVVRAADMMERPAGVFEHLADNGETNFAGTRSLALGIWLPRQ